MQRIQDKEFLNESYQQWIKLSSREKKKYSRSFGLFVKALLVTEMIREQISKQDIKNK